MGSKHLFFIRIDLTPFLDSQKAQTTYSLYIMLNFLLGYLCPGINILGNIYNIDTPVCTSDGELLTFEWIGIRHFFPKGE